MLDLRTGLAAPSDLLNYADEGLAASYRAIDAAGANPIKRGWVSTSEGLQGSDLLAEANAAERAGDMLRAQQLELQAQDHMQRAQTWAPTTQNFTDIDGLGAAADWLGGQVGSGTRSMIAPLAGGVGGRVVGGIAGGLIAGPAGAAIGANLGGIGGAFVPSYDMQYNESVGQSMMDPEIRAKRTAEEIHRTGQGVGVVGGALDAIVPASIAKAGMGGIGKRTIGKVIARETGEELLTEGTQNLVGQTGQNHLAGRELTDYDYKEAFNAAMAGAVGGGVMGGAGAAVGAARDKLAAGGEKVKEFKDDPIGKTVEAVHSVVRNKSGDKELDAMIKQRDDMLAAGVPAKEIVETILRRKGQNFTDPLNDEERSMDDRAIDTRRSEMAVKDAQDVLNSAPGMYSQAEREAAAKLIAGEVSWDKVREIRRQGDADRKAKQQSDDMARAFGMDEDDLRALEQQKPETKNSLMRPTLTDDFGEIEGRDMSQDFVTDNRGRIVRGNANPDIYSGDVVDQRQKGIEGITTGNNIAPHVYGQKVDARTTNTNVSDTPYEGDTFRYDGSPELRATDAAESAFNYDSIQRSAGIQAAQSANLEESVVPNDERGFGSTVRRVTALQRKWDKEATKEQAARTVEVADVLIRGGYWPKDIVDAAKSTTQKSELLNQAATMLSWMKYGMKDKRHPGDPDSATEALILNYGASALKMFDSAYDVAVSTGLTTRDDGKAQETRALLQQAVADHKAHGDIVMNNLSDEWKSNVKSKEDLDTLVREVRRMVNTGSRKAIRSEGPSGEPTADEKVLSILFPNPENRRAVQLALYDRGMSDRAFGAVSPTAELGKEQGEVARAGKRTKGADDMDSGDFTRQIDELDGGALKQEKEARDGAGGVAYVTRPGGHAFRVRDEGARAALAEAKTKAKVPGVRIEEVGAVTAALDKARRENGGALSEGEKEDVQARTVRRYMQKALPERPTAPPKDASAMAKNIYKQDLARWQKRLGNLVRALDRTHVVIKTVETKGDMVNAELDYEAVRASQLDRKLDDARNRPEEGTLWVGTKRGAKMLISAPQVLRLAFQNRSADSHQDVGFSGKNKEGDEVQINFGSAQNVYHTLLRSMGDISLMDEFDGTWGYVEAGGEAKPVEGKKALPKNFTLLKKNDKRGALTVGDVGDAKKDLAARLSELKDADVDPNDLGQPTRRIAARLWQKVGALRAELKRMPEGETKSALDRMLSKVQEISAARRNEGMRGDAVLPPAWHKTISNWMAALNLRAGAIDVAEGHHEVGQAVAGLAAYDPLKSIVRGEDDKGMVTTSNIGLQAQTVIGTTKKVSAGGEKSVGSATRKYTADERNRLDAVANNKNVAWDFPSDKSVHKMALEVNDGTEALRMLATSEMQSVTEAIQSMPIVRAMIRAGYVDHIAIDSNLTGDKYGYMKSFEPEGGTLKQVVVLSPRLFGDMGKYRLKIVAHEVAHTLEGIVGLGQFKKAGRMAMLARKIDQESALGKLLKMPLQANSFDPKSTSFAQELHAQLFAAYVHPDIREKLKQHQELFYRLDKLYGNQAKLLDHLTGGGRSARPNAARRNEAPSGDAGVERGVSDQVRGDDGGNRQPSGQGVSGELPPTVKERLIEALSTVKPVSREHGAAIKNALAVLKGEKEGPTDAALYRVFDASGYLGKPKQAESTVEDAPPIDEVPEYVRDYEEEYGFDPELSGMDAAMFEAPAQVAEAPVTPTAADQLQAYLDANKGKSVVWEKAATKAIADGNDKQIAGALAAAKKQFGELDAEDGATKNSEQAPSAQASTTPEQQAKVEAELHRILGDDIRILFEEMVGKSGSWAKGDTINTIKLAANGDIMSTGFHEAMHQMFALLKQHKGQEVTDALQRIAMGPVMQQRLRKLLTAHPEAMGQLKDPEEAVAYMFQFWMMDPSGFKLGPEAKTLFQQIKTFFEKALAVLSKTVRDKLSAEEVSAQDMQTVQYLMGQLASGKMADKTGRAAVVQALAADVQKRDAALERLGDGYQKLFHGVGRFFATSEGLLESYNIPQLTQIARMFNQRAGEAKGKDAAYLEEVRFRSNKKEAEINKILHSASKEDLEIAREWLSKHPDRSHPSPEINEVVQGVHKFLAGMREYIKERGITRLEDGEWVPIDFMKHYFPRVWDTDAVSNQKEQFLADLMTEHKSELEAISKESGETVDAIAEAIMVRVMNPRSQVDLDENLSDLGMTPAATAVNRRALTWLNMDVFDKYMSKDMANILHSYAHNMIQRGEYQHRFGPAGKKLKEMVDESYLKILGGDTLVRSAHENLDQAVREWGERMRNAKDAGVDFSENPPTLKGVGIEVFKKQEGEGADAKVMAAYKKIEPALKTIMGMEGTLGADIDPGLRTAQNWIVTYTNYRVLAPGLFTQFMDVMGIVRNGGEFKDAWEGFVAGIKEAKNVMLDKHDDSEMMQRAELFGTADSGTFMTVMSQHSGGTYMGGKAREWSDKLFKYNGMSGWNRGIRAYATTAAERIILNMKKDGIDPKNKAAQAYFERLYGKDFTPADIKLDAQGRLDATDSANIAAVNRWVHDAVIAPNAAHRPYIMNDPHFQIFAHLKSFAYSMHAVMLKQVASQARLGNYRPALVTLLAYAPIAIAAGAVKEMLIPGDEPYWMKQGLSGYLDYGWDRAGVLGIPQMYGNNLFDSDPAAAFGPFANQIQDLLTVPFGQLQVEVPLTDMKLGWRDHRVFEEAMAAAPFGSVLRRGGKSIDDWIEEN